MLIAPFYETCSPTAKINSKLLMIEQIPQLDGETGARARSASVGYTLYFANIPVVTSKNISLVNFLSDRVKYSG
jgi:hypothetical protein